MIHADDDSLDRSREASERSTAEHAREWTGMASAYARGLAGVYAGLVEPVLDTVDARVALAGARLLDVGCGTGRLVAAAVARGAQVTGVDPAADMRELTRAAAPQATVLEGLAPTLPVAPDSMDVVTADFVLDHAGDPRAAVADFVRVTRSGGVVAAAIWASDTMLKRLWAQVAAETDAAPVVRLRMPEHLDFARTGTGLAAVLGTAGLVDIDIHTVAWLARFDPEDLWAAPAAGIGQLGHLLAGQDEDTVERAKRAFDRIVAGRDELVCEAILGVGRKP